MRNPVFFLLLALVVGLTACKSTPESASTSEATSEDLSSYPSPDPQSIERAANGSLGDSTMFPYVYQGEGRSNWFEAYTMRFQLGYDEQLYPMTNLQTPWLKPDAYSEQTGVFITYVRNGRELSLQNPYIQVQYIRRDLPFCSSVDSIFIWLDDLHLNRKNAEVMTEPFERETASGKTAIFKEYNVPRQEDKQISEKQIAYAYVPYDDTYFIGFAMTTVNEYDFQDNKDLFYQVVESFEYR